MRKLFIWLFFSVLTISCFADEPLFDAKVLPSIADKELDFWFYTPPNTGPVIPVVRKVYPNQTFMLLIFCRVHPADSQAKANISYDMKLIAPDGEIAIDEKNRSYYQGPILGNKLIISNDHVLEMAFEASDMFGTYQIQMEFHENISNRSFSTSAEVELVKFEKPEAFASEEELSDWIMAYYQQPDPIRSFSAIFGLVQTDKDWLRDNYATLAFFRRIFLDNSFLWEYYTDLYKEMSGPDQKKMLLVAAVTPASREKSIFLKEVQDGMQSFYDEASKIAIPNTDQEITTAVQLDILWSEFLASGTYQPVKRIVSALAFKKYEPLLDQVKSKEKELTEEIEKELLLGITFQAAEWSLISNCMQFRRVHQYCQTVYERETLDPDIKKSLGVVLAVVDIKKQKEMEEEEQKVQGK